ncbi:phage baseplate assembly protein V [Roseospira marina]|uniref:Phage baseplate assembly protein V n=1 Tax=Roseospira marina TaxID=140057 RepID=A0A5M6I5F1_9PROT|nr:phage baseplate assembly protein V [Roseospira marina]KAA5603029.1 phage baseplate assembly protein V [Roseospira marina]MBB4313017.1 phage baseplate assembly protein V [Roseospira marina]MBB5089280.1 phage baseplate assembly protein V [Roseospira marina]
MERAAPNRDLTDLERRVANVVRFGVVSAADYARARVRVTAGAITTGWLPFVTARAHDHVTWCPPEVGEQVVVVAPTGDLAQGVVIGAVYRDAYPAPESRPTLDRTVYADGSTVAYDREAHAFTLDVVAAGSIRLRVGPSSLEIDADGIRLEAPRIDLN